MNNKLIISLFLGTLLTSCSGFLDETPRHAWTVEKAMTTREKAVHSVNGIYYRIAPGDNLNAAFNTALAIKAGFFNTTSSDYTMTYTQTVGGNSGVWSQLFIAVNAANLAITGIPGIADAAFPTPEEKGQLIAEAKMLRAWMNSIQLFNFCYWYADDNSPYGIIFRDETTNAQNTSAPRLSIGDSYTRILQDLDDGINGMGAFSTNRRVSPIFGKALKAKILLNRGSARNNTADLQAALSLVNELLTTDIPASSIKMEADMAELYKKSWDSEENIFVRYLEDDANRTSNSGYYSNYGYVYNGYATNLKTPADPTSDPVDNPPLCGLKYGADWIPTDPRYPIVVGVARKAETWDDSYCYTWTKIYRRGTFAGKEAPVDEKYACYYLRLPELYIMQAELLARTGASLADAIAPINTMRAKRTNPVLPAIPVPATLDDLYDIIFKEYVNELILENGAEFFASIRIKKNGVPYMDVIKGGTMEKERLQWPIPDAEIKVNKLIEQNPLQK